jgi:hypothetical protein
MLHCPITGLSPITECGEARCQNFQNVLFNTGFQADKGFLSQEGNVLCKLAKRKQGNKLLNSTIVTYFDFVVNGKKYFYGVFNPLNAELNPICYLLALLGAHHFLHISRIRVNLMQIPT